MNGAVVLDTSVVIKWFRQGEVLADRALALREAYLDGQIVVSVPSLLAYELTNVLRYKEDLTTGQIQDAVQSLFDMGLEWVLPSSAVLRRAVEIACAYETTVYDAAFAALAESLNATFVTADERLVRRLEALAFVRFLGEGNGAIVGRDS
ncbi:MAG: type II toxin-antitoxin system VapC family toxin [Anaerolineae bacterium]|nr:type II toxin-antitoxin system VapC family toxin [Anaerolineae bacterium]